MRSSCSDASRGARWGCSATRRCRLHRWVAPGPASLPLTSLPQGRLSFQKTARQLSTRSSLQRSSPESRRPRRTWVRTTGGPQLKGPAPVLCSDGRLLFQRPPKNVCVDMHTIHVDGCEVGQSFHSTILYSVFLAHTWNDPWMLIHAVFSDGKHNNCLGHP